MAKVSDAPGYPAWAHTAADVLEHHQVDARSGLTDAQVEAKRIIYGYNELEKEQGVPLWKLVLAQFDDMLVKASCHTYHRALCSVHRFGRRKCFVQPAPAVYRSPADLPNRCVSPASCPIGTTRAPVESFAPAGDAPDRLRPRLTAPPVATLQILLVAAMISFAIAYFEEGSAEEGLRSYIEPFVILAILIINAVVGVWQECNAEAALDALNEMQSEHAVVLRNGKLVRREE